MVKKIWEYVTMINIFNGEISIGPISKSYMFLSLIGKPIDHYHVPKGNPKDGNKSHRYIPIRLNFAIKDNSDQWHGKVSYAKITNETTVYTGSGDNTESHKIEITSGYFVELDNQVIAIAPVKKTKAFKEKFCKAIVWQLMNDETTLKEKLKEISFSDTLEIPAQVIPAGFIPWLNLTITEECVV